MKRTHILAVGVALSVACALPVRAAAGDESVGEHVKDAAQDTGHAIKKGAEATGHALKKGAEETGEFLGLTSSDAARYQANERAQHRMFGHVTAINHESGVVDVKTAETPLQLQFPPKAVRNVKKGDAITVQLGYAMADTGTAEKAYDAPKTHQNRPALANEHWIKGTVGEVNRDSGVVSVQTEKDRTLTLHFPPSDIANLNTGDHIAVQMGFEKGNHLQKPPTNG
jgi:hypothetical protein